MARPTKPFFAPWLGKHLTGLCRQPDGRWRIIATGERFGEPDERRAVLAVGRVDGLFRETDPAQPAVDPVHPQQRTHPETDRDAGVLGQCLRRLLSNLKRAVRAKLPVAVQIRRHGASVLHEIMDGLIPQNIPRQRYDNSGRPQGGEFLISNGNTGVNYSRPLE